MYFVAGWEIDALFLTAILTVIGFSVNDTIVVFDRIRENLRRYRTERFATIANRSVIETAQRSIATQVTALLVLVAILVLGGATLRQFMATLIVGLVSGTYSSLFTATPILVAWEEGSLLGRRPPQQVCPQRSRRHGLALACSFPRSARECRLRRSASPCDRRRSAVEYRDVERPVAIPTSSIGTRNRDAPASQRDYHASSISDNHGPDAAGYVERLWAVTVTSTRGVNF